MSSNGELIVSGSLDGTVRRWRASSGKAIGEPLYSDNGIEDVAISEDDKYIVSGSDEGEILLWDTLSGEAIGLPLRGSECKLSAVAVNRERKLILSGHKDGTVYHWDVSAQGNDLAQHRPLALLDEMPNMSCVTESASDKLAVSGSEDNGVRKPDTSTDEAVRPPMEGGVHSLTISKDGTLIVSGGMDGIVQRWDASTGESVGEPMYGHRGTVLSIIISDDGKLIVTGSNDKTVRRWDARNGKAIGKPMEYSSWVADLAISTDCSVIVSGYDDECILR